MANFTGVKVSITAERVGPELEAYIEAVPRYDYEVVSTGYAGQLSYRTNRDGETWDFKGYTYPHYRRQGGGSYGSVLRGLFGANREHWFAKEAVPPEWLALEEAIKRTGGYIAFEWAEADATTHWLSAGNSASLSLSEAGAVVFEEVRAGNLDYTIENMMKVFEWDFPTAFGLIYREDQIVEFFEFWKTERWGQDPTGADADAYFKKKWAQLAHQLAENQASELPE